MSQIPITKRPTAVILKFPARPTIWRERAVSFTIGRIKTGGWIMFEITIRRKVDHENQ